MKSNKIGMHINPDINSINLTSFMGKINNIQLFINFSQKKKIMKNFLNI